MNKKLNREPMEKIKLEPTNGFHFLNKVICFDYICENNINKGSFILKCWFQHKFVGAN